VHCRVHHLVHMVPMVNDSAVLAFVRPRFATCGRLCQALSGIVAMIVMIMIVIMRVCVVCNVCVFMPVLMRMTYPKTRRTYAPIAMIILIFTMGAGRDITVCVFIPRSMTNSMGHSTVSVH
jgi:hypothetical protein